MTGKAICLAAFLVAMMSMPARAGNVVMTSTGTGVAAVISGDLDAGDIPQLQRIAATGQLRAVILAGPGGSTATGYGIGLVAHRLGIPTFVPAGIRCVSACAMAWLGGTPRILQGGASVGFHRPYNPVTRLGRQTNDIDRAYLAEVGVPQAALDFMFARGADDLEWLTLDVARKYGIQVTLIP